MKELQPQPQDKETAAAHRPVIKQTKLDSLVPYPGQKLWEFNTKTGHLREAEYESTVVDFGTKEVTRKVIIREHCKYVLAINKFNAQKKFFRNS